MVFDCSIDKNFTDFLYVISASPWYNVDGTILGVIKLINIYLIRHGETDCNAMGIWQGNLDMSLNDKGIFQAETLSEGLAYKLKDKHVKTVYSSPLARAIETAEMVARKLNAKIALHNDLRDTELASISRMGTW